MDHIIYGLRTNIYLHIEALFKLKSHEHVERLGKSEIELVNIFIEGLAAIIKLEQKLEAGEDIETDIALVSL